MKNTLLPMAFCAMAIPFLFAQTPAGHDQESQEIRSLIDKYTQARETQDTALLRRILMTDVDQLVSTGEWRDGIAGSMKGMMRSSENNPGTRTIIVEKIRLLNSDAAIADARYEIQNPDGTVRRMWSAFIVVRDRSIWKISAIRNMLPAVQR